MNMDDMVLVSVDDHVVEPPDMFDEFIPAKWKDKAPKVIHKDDGTDVWVFGDVVKPIRRNIAAAGLDRDEMDLNPISFDTMRKGCYDIDERINDMNANGVLGSMCFPSFPQFCGQLFSRTEDKSVALAMLQAYNDWHIDEWCGTYPDRFIPLAIPPIWDPKLVADEVRRVIASRGSGSTSMRPAQKGALVGRPLHGQGAVRSPQSLVRTCRVAPWIPSPIRGGLSFGPRAR